MPKSRGRRKTHRSARGRTAPRSWTGTVISDAGRLLAPDATRLQAEAFASLAIGSATMSGDSGTRYVGEEAVQALVADASKRRSANSTAVVAALMLVSEAAAVRSAWQAWARDASRELPWVEEPAPPLRRAAVAGDPYDDYRVTLLDHGDHVIIVETSRGFGETVETVVVADPDAFDAWDAEELGELREVTTEEAVRPLLSALSHAEILWPPVEDEGYHTYRLLLESRLRETGVVPAEYEPMSDDEERALLDRFFADVELPDDDVSRELAGLCVTFGNGWLPGGPLAWSPSAVERFLFDWVPRKTFLDEERQRTLPAVTFAYVGWALIERGVDREAAIEAATLALDLRDEFVEQYDETEKSPATLIAQRIQDAGIDPLDREAVDRVVSEYNAEQLALRMSER